MIPWVKEGVTVKDAAHEWVKEFNGIPQDMIWALMKVSPDEWHEITMPAITNRVYLYDVPDESNESHFGEITHVKHRSSEDDCDDYLYTVKLDDGTVITVNSDAFEVDYDDVLPIWGTMWSFNEWLDDEWLKNYGGLRAMSDCGFRVYEHDEWGYFFGIDGAGYGFYEAHWIPLYRARGLKWHDETLEDKNGK